MTHTKIESASERLKTKIEEIIERALADEKSHVAQKAVSGITGYVAP